MRIVEDIDNPNVIEVDKVYNGEDGCSIKVTKISIDIHRGIKRPDFIVDFDWKSPSGKTGKEKGASISQLLQYFKD